MTTKGMPKNRPHKSTDELVQKKVLPKATYDKIKAQIIGASVEDGRRESSRPELWAGRLRYG